MHGHNKLCIGVLAFTQDADVGGFRARGTRAERPGKCNVNLGCCKQTYKTHEEKRIFSTLLLPDRKMQALQLRRSAGARPFVARQAPASRVAVRPMASVSVGQSLPDFKVVTDENKTVSSKVRQRTG